MLNKSAGFGTLPPPVSRPSAVGPAFRALAALDRPFDPAQPRGGVPFSALEQATLALATLAPLAALPARVDALGDKAAAGLVALVQRIELLTDAVSRINPAPTTPPTTVSNLAFRVLARVGQVRDALCDLDQPTLKSINERLQREREADSTVELQRLLEAAHSPLLADFTRQFRKLDNRDFEPERRARVAELVAFEWRAMTELQDAPQGA